MKKTLLSLLLFLLAFTVCFSQATREELQLNKSYSLVKIYKRSNQILKGRNLTLINDSTIIYKDNKTFKSETIAVKDLRSLKVKSGTKVVPFALYGAGFMALVSLEAWAQVESDPYLETKDNAGGIIVGLIAVGAVVGGLIGMATPKWKGIAIPRRKSSATSLYLNPGVGIQKDCFALSLKMKF